MLHEPKMAMKNRFTRVRNCFQRLQVSLSHGSLFSMSCVYSVVPLCQHPLDITLHSADVILNIIICIIAVLRTLCHFRQVLKCVFLMLYI